MADDDTQEGSYDSSPLLRAEAYGPESEGATAADKGQLHGAFVRNLQKGHIAVSPDLLGKYPAHSVWDAVDPQGNVVRRGLVVADTSWIGPKNPTHNTVELYNDRDLGHLRLIPSQQGGEPAPTPYTPGPVASTPSPTTPGQAITQSMEAIQPPRQPPTTVPQHPPTTVPQIPMTAVGALGILPTMPVLPSFAEGGKTEQGTIALVGEKGPEIVKLPPGAEVIPVNGQTPTRAFQEGGSVDDEEVTTQETRPPTPQEVKPGQQAAAAPQQRAAYFEGTNIPTTMPAPPAPGQSLEDAALEAAIMRHRSVGSEAVTDEALTAAILKSNEESHSFWGWTGKFLNAIPGTVEETLGNSYAGVMNAIGSTLDSAFQPDKRFVDQSVPQLLDQVGKTQDRINELTAKKNSNPSEYNFVQAQDEIDSLEGDLRSMRRALSAKSGYQQPASDFGQSFLSEGQKAAQFMREQRGDEPWPAADNPVARFMQGTSAPYPRDVEFERSWQGKVAAGIGQTVAFAAAAKVGLGLPGEATLFAAPSFQQVYQESIDQGKSPGEAAMAGYATVPGSAAKLLMFRVLLGSASAGVRSAGEVKANLWRSAAIRGAVGMPAANAAGQAVDNLIAGMSGIDPNRPWNQGVFDNVIQDAVFGLVTGGIHDYASWHGRAISKPDIDPYKPPGSDTTPQIRTPEQGGPTPPRTPDLVTQPVEHSSSVGEGAAEREAIAAETERELSKTEVEPTPAQTPAQQLGNPTTADELSAVHQGIVNDMERLMNEMKSGQPDVTAQEILQKAGTPEEALSEGTNAAVAELAPERPVTVEETEQQALAARVRANAAALAGEEVVPPQKATQTTSGLETIGEAGTAISKNLREMLWDKFIHGITTEAGGPSNLLRLAAREKAAGRITTRSEFEDFVTRYGESLKAKQPIAEFAKSEASREKSAAAIAAAAPTGRLSQADADYYRQIVDADSNNRPEERDKLVAQGPPSGGLIPRNFLEYFKQGTVSHAVRNPETGIVGAGVSHGDGLEVLETKLGRPLENLRERTVGYIFKDGLFHLETENGIEPNGVPITPSAEPDIKVSRQQAVDLRNTVQRVAKANAGGNQEFVEGLVKKYSDLIKGKTFAEADQILSNLKARYADQGGVDFGEIAARRDAAQTGVVSLADRAMRVTKGLLRSVMKGLIKAIGPRADFLIANASSLPKRYDAALAAHGLTRATFKAFYDHATGDFVVNPDNFTDVNELYDAVMSKFLPNTFGKYVTVVPIRSWKDHTDNQDINRMLIKDPNADSTTSGLYSRTAGTAFINVSKLLQSPNPIREATKTIVHEIGIHQGLQMLFPSFGTYDNFLLGMYGKLVRSGVGNQIAGQFETTMEGLARKYGYGTDVDGVWTMTDRQKMRMAEELLARYAERYDPQQLSKLPGTLKRMLDLVHTGLDRWQGIELSHAELFHIVQDSWKASEPQRAASSVAAIQVKQATKAHDNEDSESESSRRADPDTAELETNARRSGIGGDVPANDGRSATETDIRSSSERVGRSARAQGNQYDEERLRAAAPVYAAGGPGDTHDIRLSPGTGRVWKVTRPDAEPGPYGSAPASERAAAITDGRLAREAAAGTAEGPAPAERASAAAAGATAPGPAAAGGPAPAGGPGGAEAGAAALPGQPGAGGAGRITERYDTGRATADQYLRRLALANRLFGVGNRLEGTMQDPESGLSRIISTQPQYGPDTTTEATHTDIASYMSARGFEQIDSDTYYDPRRKVIVLEAHPDSVRLDQTTGKIHMLDANPHEVSGELARELDERVAGHDWSALSDEPEELAQQLAHHGLLARPEETAEMERRLNAQAQADRAEVEQIRSLQATRDLSPEEQQRLDDLEMGPMLEKDIRDELEGSVDPNEAPMELLKRAYESQKMARRMRPHPERMASDPKAPDAVQLFNASPSQIETDRVGRDVMNAQTDRLLESYGDDTARVYGDLVNGGFHTADEWSSLEVPVYFRVVDEIRAKRAEALARGDQVTVNQLDDAHMRADQYMTKNLSAAGKTLNFWRHFIESREGMTAQIRGLYQNILEGRVRRDGNWRDTRDRINQAATKAQNDAINDAGAQRIINAAQGAHDRQTGQGKARRFRLVGEKIGGAKERAAKEKVEEEQRPLGLKIADTLTQEFARAIGVATRKAGLTEDEAQVKSLADAVKAKIREQLPSIAEKMRGGPEEKAIKPSATDTIHSLLNRWGDFENLFNQASASMRHGMDPGRLGVFLQELKTALDMPLTNKQLNRFLTEQDVSIKDLVRGHWSYRGRTMNSLRDVLLEHTNLDERQARIVDENMRRVLNSKITEETQREFQRLIDQTEGGKATPENKAKALQRLMELVNMGAFSSDQVADALGILYGFDKSYLPSIELQLKPLIDRFEKYKSDSRAGRATVDIQYQLSRAIGEHARIGFWEYWNNALLGNLISGVPSHVKAFANELMTGSLNAYPMYLRTLRRAGITPGSADATRFFWASVSQLQQGFAKSLPEAAETLRTGVSPKYTRFTALDELARPGIPKINVFERRATERVLAQIPGVGQPLAFMGRYGVDVPMRTVFRAVDALHSIISGTFGNQTAHMLAVRMYSDEGMPFNQALDQARDMMMNPNGMRLALEQQARGEAVTDGRDPNGWQAKMRLNELIEQHFPQMIRDESAYWASEANLFNKPYGALGALDNGLEKFRNDVPFMKQVFPIVRLAMNLYNYSLDLSPIGVFRWWQHEAYLTQFGRGMERETQAESQARQARGEAVDENTIPYERYQELRGQLLFRGIVGTALWGAVAALPQMIPGFRINGNGPSNPDQRHQWMDRGGQPYSFEYNGHFVPFEYFPPFMILGAIGNYYDSVRYHPTDNPLTPFAATLAGLPGQILDRTVLMGLSNLVEIGKQSERDPTNAAETILSYIENLPAQATPVAGSIFLKNLTQAFDSRVFEKHGWGLVARSIPFAPSTLGARPRINVMGENIHVNNPYFGRFWSGGEAHTPADRIFDFLNDHGLKMGNPTHHDLMGQEMTHDQLYDFTILKGQAMQRLVDPELDRLGQITDHKVLLKEWTKLEKTASNQAIGRMLAGEHGIAQ